MAIDSDYILGTHSEEIFRLGTQHQVWRAHMPCPHCSGASRIRYESVGGPCSMNTRTMRLGASYRVVNGWTVSSAKSWPAGAPPAVNRTSPPSWYPCYPGWV